MRECETDRSIKFKPTLPTQKCKQTVIFVRVLKFVALPRPSLFHQIISKIVQLAMLNDYKKLYRSVSICFKLFVQNRHTYTFHLFFNIRKSLSLNIINFLQQIVHKS